MVAVCAVVFIVIRVVPGDPAAVILGDQATPEALNALRAKLGLDRPLHLQFIAFLADVFTLDFGVSLISGKPIAEEILRVLPYTFELTFAALLFAVVIGVPLGVLAASRPNEFVDAATRLFSLIGVSFPAFISGILILLLFAIHFPWFPVINDGQGGSLVERLRSLVLPAISLGLIMAAYVTRSTRSAMLAVLNEDYIRTARAKGIGRRNVIWKHGLRNAAIPVTTIVGLYLGTLLGNSVLTEIVFSRPGLGKLILGAVTQRDYTMLQSLVVVFSFCVIVANIATDIAYSLLDKRVRLT